MIPTEKAVIRRILVWYVYNLFVYVLTVVLSKIRKLQYTNMSKLVRLHFSIYYRHIFTAIYRFHKMNSRKHINIMAFEIRYTC